jgi:MFS family permease
MKRLSILDLLSLNAYWLGLSFMWSALHPIVLPAVLLNLVPETQKNTYLGLLTFAGLIIAMVVQPLSGALSDRWSSRWGRRRPLILLGTLFDLVFLFMLGWLGGLVWLVIGYLGLQLSSNIAHGPAQGLLPDRVPPDQLGTASGIKNLMDMGGIIAASLLAGRLLDPQAQNLPVVMLVLIAILLTPAAITLLGARERPAHPQPVASTTPTLLDVFRIDFKANPDFWWLIAGRFCFLLGVYGIQSFAQYYVQDVLLVPNPVQTTGDLLAAITLALVGFSLLGGWLSDRYGAKPVMYAAALIGGAGCLLLLLAKSPATLLVYGAVAGAGIGLFLTANWTLANRLAPAAEAGKFMGLTNLATAGSAAAGRLMGPGIDLLNNLEPGRFLGYSGLFIFAALSIFLSAVFLRGVKERRRESAL